jgi:hypothetical protein
MAVSKAVFKTGLTIIPQKEKAAEREPGGLRLTELWQGLVAHRADFFALFGLGGLDSRCKQAIQGNETFDLLFA